MSVAELSREDIANLRYKVTQMMEADLQDVVEIEESTGLSRWGLEAYRLELFNNPMSIMRVARGIYPYNIERHVLGFVASRLTVDELHINNIATHHAFRRLRIGVTLMESAMQESRMFGGRRCILEVRASNVSAQAMYNRLGFNIIGRRRDYYTFPTEDALVMQMLY